MLYQGISLSPISDNPSMLQLRTLKWANTNDHIMFKIQYLSSDPEPCITEVTCSDCDAIEADCNIGRLTKERPEKEMLEEEISQSLGAKLKYRCEPGKQFNMTGRLRESLTLTCESNRTWSPLEDIPGCVCKPMSLKVAKNGIITLHFSVTGCTDPPIPPKESNLTMDYEKGTEVPLGEVVKYRCRPGFAFEKDPTLNHFEVVCHENGTFEHPKYWKTCAPPTGSIFDIFIKTLKIWIFFLLQ